jgi:hypothetical protein
MVQGGQNGTVRQTAFRAATSEAKRIVRDAQDVPLGSSGRITLSGNCGAAVVAIEHRKAATLGLKSRSGKLPASVPRNALGSRRVKRPDAA